VERLILKESPLQPVLPMNLPKQIRLTPTLTSVIGAFVLITAALVLSVQVFTSERVTRTMAAEMIMLGMEALQNEFAAQLDAIEEQAAYTARAIKSGAILLDDTQELATFAYGALAATPQASLILVVTAEGQAIKVQRGAGDGVFVPETIPVSKAPQYVELAQKAAAAKGSFWTPVSYVAAHGHSYVTYVVPMREGDTYIGSVVVGVSLRRLSEIAQRISTETLTVFLLYDDDQVLAHPQMHEVEHTLSPVNPTIDLHESPDGFLAEHFKHEIVQATDLLPANMELKLGTDENGEQRFIVMQDSGEKFGALSILIGAHFPGDFLLQSFEELTNAILIGLLLLAASLVGAALLSHYIARPIKRAASGARAVAQLDLGSVPALPNSIVRELDDLATGYNAMVGGLSAFTRYMPSTLVGKLVREGRIDSPPEEREVAVLFTDIAGFTAISEGMGASETADFVNEHLTLLGKSIRKHGGTIDKYIGDSLMAFWGAPETLDSPARAAALAALDIAADLHQDNRRREQKGLPPVRVRIGVHSGPLVVGDIGAPERVNYTVIGDTVNVASRLESLGREVDPKAEVIILASGIVGQQIAGDIAFEALGAQKVKGKDALVDVIRLQQARNDEY
jgi:adenylate cyclase